MDNHTHPSSWTARLALAVGILALLIGLIVGFGGRLQLPVTFDGSPISRLKLDQTAAPTAAPSNDRPITIINNGYDKDSHVVTHADGTVEVHNQSTTYTWQANQAARSEQSSDLAELIKTTNGITPLIDVDISLTNGMINTNTAESNPDVDIASGNVFTGTPPLLTPSFEFDYTAAQRDRDLCADSPWLTERSRYNFPNGPVQILWLPNGTEDGCLKVDAGADREDYFHWQDGDSVLLSNGSLPVVHAPYRVAKFIDFNRQGNIGAIRLQPWR
ncbi:MAG: hypothetical protein M3Q44_00725 [bacterium]|nr:hypothetical protein [bacterium]